MGGRCLLARCRRRSAFHADRRPGRWRNDRAYRPTHSPGGRDPCVLRPADGHRARTGRPTGLRQADRGIDDRRCENLESRAENFPIHSRNEGSMHGLAVGEDGKRVFVTGSTEYLLEARCTMPRRLELAATHRAGCRQSSRDGSRPEPRRKIGFRLQLDRELPDRRRLGVRQDSGHGSHRCLPIRRRFEPRRRHSIHFELRWPASSTRRTCRALGRKSVAVDDRSISISGTITRVDLKTLKSDGRT